MTNNIVLMLGGHQQPALPVQSPKSETDITVVAMYGQSASMLAGEHKDVDLIILDADVCPEIELETCRYLRSYHSAPLLLLTRELTESHLIRAYEAGVDECVVKPISDELLMAKVKAWLHFTNWNPPSHYPAGSSSKQRNGATVEKSVAALDPVLS